MSMDFLAVLDEHWPTGGAQVRETLARASLEAIESASRVQWLPLEHHTQLNDRALDALGRQQFQKVWRWAMLRVVESKTLRATVTGALRLFGATPASLIKLAPRAWDLLARDAGKLTVNIDQDQANGRMTLTDFPMEHFRSGSFAEGLVGVIESFLDICETSGEVTLASNTPAVGRAVYEITWR